MSTSAYLFQATPMSNTAEPHAMPNTTGIILHRPFFYDLMHWLRGGEQAFREKTLDLAGPQPGEWVLDVGCGTGTLAVAAKRRVGAAGAVYAIDASPEMIGRARKKARKNAVDVRFENAAVQKLPFPDGSFDAVLSTVMLHHLDRTARQQCLCEIRRVLKPGGRVLAVDFGESSAKCRGFFGHFHRHGHVTFPELRAMLNEAGLKTVKSGTLGSLNLEFLLARTPSCARTAPI
ncbi:MAG: class I SAM-dependent methyltransferase [Terriglobia bacterium]